MSKLRFMWDRNEGILQIVSPGSGTPIRRAPELYEGELIEEIDRLTGELEAAEQHVKILREQIAALEPTEDPCRAILKRMVEDQTMNALTIRQLARATLDGVSLGDWGVPEPSVARCPPHEWEVESSGGMTPTNGGFGTYWARWRCKHCPQTMRTDEPGMRVPASALNR
jgi:hypothetical protein